MEAKVCIVLAVEIFSASGAVIPTANIQDLWFQRSR